MNSRAQSGYILLLTLSLITFFVFLTTYLFNQSFMFLGFAKTMSNQEKARQLAYGGIELVRDFLSTKTQEESKEAAGSPEAGQKQAKSSQNGRFLKLLLQDLNRGQTFTLKKNIEGLDATLSILISSEEGKIDLNKLYDFQKHQFINQGQPNTDMKIFMQEIFKLLEEKIKANLFEPLEKFLKEKKVPINDVTELLAIKEFEVFRANQFFNPFSDPTAGSKIYLTDLFTVSSSGKGIEPWLISHSLGSLLKFTPEKDRQAAIEQALKNFKEKANWSQDWNKSLKLLYGVDFNALPKNMAILLNSSYGPKMFSTLCQAKVGQASVALFAILERKPITKNNQMTIEVTISKVYLL